MPYFEMLATNAEDTLRTLKDALKVSFIIFTLYTRFRDI